MVKIIGVGMLALRHKRGKAMSVNILSQNKKILVNYDNIASLYIQKQYVQYSHPDTWWEIKILYPFASKDIECTLARFEDEKMCESTFIKIVNLICEQKEDLILIDEILKV